jgi:hypothetical protein
MLENVMQGFGFGRIFSRPRLVIPWGRREMHIVGFVRKPKVTSFAKTRRSGRIILKCNLKPLDGEVSSGRGQGHEAGFCEHGYDPSGSTLCPASRGT